MGNFRENNNSWFIGVCTAN